MGIIVNKETRVIVQGITGTQGQFHTSRMLDYGTRIVAGITPGKGGSTLFNVPVYDTVAQAQYQHDADTSIIFVPARYAGDAAWEALEQGITTVIIITEHMPIRDTIELIAYAKHVNAQIIGPNTAGIITPSECKIGIMPAHIFQQGNIGIVSRSGTLTYEVAANLTHHQLGQSTCLGIGGDPVIGVSFTDALALFENDDQTDAIVLIGEVGGNLEEQAAAYIQNHRFHKPVVAYIAGRTAPPGVRMGHAGAIIQGSSGSAEQKITAFQTAGVQVAEKPNDVALLVQETLASSQSPRSSA
jgi:succinyl-CoA synthetase alpha subunit